MSTTTADETATNNGGEASASSDNDNIDVNVGGGEHTLDHRAYRGHVFYACHGVTEEVGADTLPG